MIFSRSSSVAVAFGVMLSLLVVPSVGQADLFDCLRPAPVVSPAPAPATYMPTTVQRVSWMPTVGGAAACNPCGQQVTLSPETRRRWTYSRIPRTTYRPVTTSDPCTGCPVTSYQAETSYSLLPWLRRESYTVYSPVATPMVSYNQPVTNTCNPCGGVVSSSYFSGSSGCSTCASGSAVSGTISSSGSSVRIIESDPAYPSQKTYMGDQESGGQTGGGLQPQLDTTIPRSSYPSNSSTKLPKLSAPRGRLAVRPIEPVTQVRTVSWELEAAPASPVRPASKPKLDFGGWHAASD